jgi:endo-1,4-beta-D-glucanase Y/4-amino-4-deoxy-L-arabinose transferase-like glycosyltransferase
MGKIFNFFKSHKIDILFITIVLLISGFAQGINMFQFPYYESDEGTYISQAWSVLTLHKLAPYTYWYDHAPLGWLFIAMWVKLTGGFYTFGFSINTGRVFMLVLHLFSTLFLYLIVRKVSKNSLAAVFATLFFSLSPLGIYYQRRVLLDNIMTFWVMLSLFLLTVPLSKMKLRYIYSSALTFGIGVLSKENAIFFIPGFLLLINQKAHFLHKRFALIKWVAVMSTIVSLYFIYALMKGELFPAGSFLGGNSPHVSLMTSFQYQLVRGGGSIVDRKNSAFWASMKTWYQTDKLLILSSIFSTISLLVISVKKRQYLPYVALSIGFWIFLTRGEVIDFYITPLIPTIGMLNGFLFAEIVSFFKSKIAIKYLGYGIGFLFIILTAGYYMKYNNTYREANIYTANETKPQLEALNYIRKNYSSNTVIVTDNYDYTDLHDPKNPSGITFPYAEYDWKIAKDPEISSAVINNEPSNIDTFAMTPQLKTDILEGVSPILSSASANSLPVKSFSQDGWNVTFQETKYPKQTVELAWNSYKNEFVKNGRTEDPENNNETTSEDQANSLLRAVWMNDRTEFDQVWKWTKDNLQLQNSLFTNSNINNVNTESKNTESNGDEDIALALLFASSQWHDTSYSDEAKKIIPSIWNDEVMTIDDTPYLTVGNWAMNNTNGAIINPSYFSPYSYRIFASVDKSHDWLKLVDTSYKVYSECSSNLLDKQNSVGLLPNWCEITSNGTVTLSNEKGYNDSTYSFDAATSNWRIALDYLWYKDPRDKAYLLKSKFLRTQWEEKGKILVGYTHDGYTGKNYQAAGPYGADIGNFIITNKKEARDIYTNILQNKFYITSNNAYWDDPENIYDQTWAWYGTALYANKLPNLWTK